MIVDTSAIIAVLRNELEAELFALALQHARTAYREFGKTGHPAQLNFGDCFAYAPAKVMGEPLLFKGRDFIHTDIASVTV